MCVSKIIQDFYICTDSYCPSSLSQLVICVSMPSHRPVGVFLNHSACDSLLPLCSPGSAAASRDQPAPHRQPGPLQRQSVRERDGIGQSCDRDVEQDPASSSRGIRSYG